MGGYQRNIIGFGSQVRTCSSFIPDSKFQYDPNNSESPWSNDFALCKLDSPVFIDDSKVTFESNINPNFPPVNTDVIAIGLGDIEQDGITPTFLKDVVVKVTSNTQCKNIFGSKQITPDMICASAPQGGAGICQGDSGGRKYRVVSCCVVSYHSD